MVVAAGGTLAGAATPSPTTPAPPTVVLLAVPGLTWADVAVMPHLAALAAQSAVGELSVKTAGSTTGCAAGLLAVSAGNRTETDNDTCDSATADWPGLVAKNEHSSYAARLGALGEALSRAAIPVTANGRGAQAMLATSRPPGHGAAFAYADPPRHGVTGIVDEVLYDATGSPASARAHLDDAVEQVVSALPADATLIVAGISDRATDGPQLHAVVIHGPGWPHVELRSSRAGRAPYVQLIDIAPTILTAEHVAIPSSMAGRPMQRSTHTPPAISSFIDDNQHAIGERTLGQRTFLVLGLVVILAMLLAASRWSTAHQSATWLARLAAPAPALIFAGNAFPWWRWGQPSYAGLVFAGCVVVALVIAVTAGRSRIAAVAVAPAVAVILLGVDQLLGAPLQLSAPLGDNPLTAGRFSGMGNLDFAAFATSAMLLGGALAARLPKRAGVVTAAMIALVAVVIDGAPQLGNDIGGVLALVPAGLVLVALVAGVAVTWRRVAVAAAVSVVVAVGVALADYSRPAANQTHVGRFVGQVLHGGAGTELRRKADAAIGSVGLTVGTFVVLVAVVLAVTCRDGIRDALDAAPPGVRASAIAAAVVGVIGVLVNDSGIAIAAMAAIVGFSAVYGAGPRVAPAT
jgi:hypothetical protein